MRFMWYYFLAENENLELDSLSRINFYVINFKIMFLPWTYILNFLELEVCTTWDVVSPETSSSVVDLKHE